VHLEFVTVAGAGAVDLVPRDPAVKRYDRFVPAFACAELEANPLTVHLDFLERGDFPCGVLELAGEVVVNTQGVFRP